MAQENLIHIFYVDMIDLNVDFEWTKEAFENEVKYSKAVDTNFEPIYESMPYTISGEQWAGIRTEDMLLSRQLVNKK